MKGYKQKPFKDNKKHYFPKNQKKGEDIEAKLKLLSIKRVKDNAEYNNHIHKKSKLNCDIWGQIFCFLEIRDLIYAKRACKLFYKSYTVNMWKFKIDLSNYGYEVNNEYLKDFAKCQYISLKGCFRLTPECLRYIENVQVLKLTRSISLKYLKCLKNLKKLYLPDYRFSGWQITDLLNCDKLEEVYLYGNLESIELLKEKGIKVIIEKKDIKYVSNVIPFLGFDLYPNVFQGYNEAFKHQLPIGFGMANLLYNY